MTKSEIHPAVLGIIPARGGSKGLPRKNILPLAGKPVIAWTIEAALKSRSVTRTIVTTEDAEIADIAKANGVEVPFQRPMALAGDEIDSLTTALHALEWLRDHEAWSPDYFVLLQPTAPLRTHADIDDAFKLVLERRAKNVVSVCEASEHPYYAVRQDGDGRMAAFMDMDLLEVMRRYPRRQDLPPAFVENGAVYIADTENFIKEKTFYTPRPYIHAMPRERSIDIDDETDLRLAERFLSDT